MIRRQASARVPFAAALVLLAACSGGGSTGPTTGTMIVAVSGLPSGVEADVTVTGPDGFTRQMSESGTLSGLATGSYTVTAAGVSSGPTEYSPSPVSQSVVVSTAEPASAEVAYGTGSGGGGSLAVTVDGLPSGTDAAVTVTGPGGYNRPVTASETLTGLTEGQYTLTALSVTEGNDEYSPAPTSQTVTVGLSGAATATINYSTGGAAGFNLRVDGLYLVQSVQTLARGVPIVADRDALLRIFVTANQVNAVAPTVRVSFYDGATLVDTETITAPGLSTPLGPNENDLGASWNLDVDRSLVTPGLAIVVEVDPDDLITEGNEGDNVFPGSGTPLVMDVRTTTPFAVRFVPVRTRADSREGNVTAGNHEDYLDATMRMHPLAAFDADVRAPYLTDTDEPLQSDNANQAWGTVLSELSTLPAVNSSRYYYGVVNPDYNSGVAGMGYIGAGVAMGWDKAGSRASVAAHEWGHNWGRRHAPCGGVGSSDPNYPYAGGEIGVVGYDLIGGDLKPADYHDLMGYCNNEWISDYTYKAVMDFRSDESFVSGMSEAIQPGLMVWGRIQNGRAVLEPAFRVTARPSLPRRSGPYRVEGRAADGSRIFGLDFAPLEVADDPNGSKHFVFVVPMRPERAERLASLELDGPGARAKLAQVSSEAVTVQATRSATGRIALRWDARKAPMIMVRDPVNGEVLSYARGGEAEVITGRDDLALTISNQVRSRHLRVSAQSR